MPTPPFDRKKFIEDTILRVIGRPQDDIIKAIIDQYTKNILCKTSVLNDEELQVKLNAWKDAEGIIGLVSDFSQL
jgi:hypothetical protein